MAKRQLGIFCGTFNPIHWGHLLMAQFALDQLQMERVFFITSPNPPHRKTDLLDAEDRYALVCAAIEDNPCFEASRIELDRTGPSYTVDTLREFKEQYGDAVELNLIVGEDNLQYIPNWRGAEQIFELARICVASRDTQNNHVAMGMPTQLPAQARCVWLDFARVPVSSTLIRQRLRDKKTVLYLVPPAVDALLIAKGFYL